MQKQWRAVIICLALMLSINACSARQAIHLDATDAGKVQVYVTFNAIKEFAQAVGGDKVVVTTIIPDGAEPHGFEPKAKDLVGLSCARVFVYNGFGMEAWVENAISAAGNKDLIAVDASSGVEPIANADGEHMGEHDQNDPHIWLSLKCAEIEVTNIKDALIGADPSNRDYYEANCHDYISKLQNLYNQYTEKFASVQKRSFVTGHAAFAYLCRDFGLSQNSVEGVFAEGEPSAQQLTELVGYCKQNDVRTIFAETMASPEVARTLANEVGAKVETIYTIASEEEGMSYLERMEDNLSKIFLSLTE